METWRLGADPRTLCVRAGAAAEEEEEEEVAADGGAAATEIEEAMDVEREVTLIDGAAASCSELGAAAKMALAAAAPNFSANPLLDRLLEDGVSAEAGEGAAGGGGGGAASAVRSALQALQRRRLPLLA
jgi:hypothetical protein